MSGCLWTTPWPTTVVTHDSRDVTGDLDEEQPSCAVTFMTKTCYTTPEGMWHTYEDSQGQILAYDVKDLGTIYVVPSTLESVPNDSRD
jgi:hypothetical protein